MARNTSRPLSPHLTIWRWGPHMLVSILHRVTGMAVTIAGLALLTWWLLALSGSSGGYGDFSAAASHPIGLLVLIGLSWAFFQHMLSGLRHLVMDIGAGYELNTNKFWANMTMVGAVVLTASLWAWIILGRGA